MFVFFNFSMQLIETSMVINYIICTFVTRLAIYTEQKKKRHMRFSMHFSKSILFSDIDKNFSYATDIRLPDAPICFLVQPIAEELATLDLLREIVSKTRSGHAQAPQFLLGRLRAITTYRIPFEHDQILPTVSRYSRLNLL